MVACAGLWWWAAHVPKITTGPIILLSIDTLRADHLPAYGYTNLRTPAIDALVSDSVLFERAYSHSPQTLPAHASMLSGALPFDHGVRDNVGFSVKSSTRLLQHFLRERGYATGGVVSADVLREETGIGQGFDFYDSRMPPTTGGASIDEVQRDGAASLAVAQQWMQGLESSRFFLFLHLYEPHAPYSPPARYSDFALYDGEIAYADEIVGRLVEYLRGRDWYDNALIVLLSDHGEGLGDHGEQEHGLFIYDEAVRVPFIIKLPHFTGRGRRVQEPVQHADLLPTVLDLTSGVPSPSGGAGRSLRALLEGQSGEWQERGIYAEALFGRYHFGWSELYSFTDSRYRFIRAPRPELYDLQQDPREQRNLAAERIQTQAALNAALDELVSTEAIDAPASISTDARERLASLGYVGPQTIAPRSASGGLPDPKDRVHILLKYRRALELEANGSFNPALDLLKVIAHEEPAMSEIWHRIGRLQLRLGHTEDAVSAYKQYVGLNPASASALIELASVLLKMREFEIAEAHAKLAVSVAPEREPTERAAAYEMLVKVALARQDSAAARRYAALGEAADPTLPLVTYAEGRLAHAAGRYEEALRSFESALLAMRGRTMPMPDLYLYAGDTLAHLGRFEEAERHFRQEIQSFPRNMWGYVSLANLYQAFERRQEAEQVLAALLQRVPSAEAHAEAAKLRSAR